jgi:hypothetical protein
MVRIEPTFQRSSFDANFWLSHCEGYLVESPSGRVGTVENVRFGKRLDRPDELLVRQGTIRRHHVWVATDDVAVINPNELRLRLKGPPSVSTGPERGSQSP